ncbi:MAG: hypothetical protein H8M99_06585 [Gloeobacteraceae cyanobacterium ES-bin-144]|nr:hypothetical protein [Verrucomicrobiales bacterium]
MSETLNPCENAVDLSRRIEDLDARLAALDTQKRGLSIDPANATEQAVESMIKAEASIDAKSAPLLKTREILTSNLAEAWLAAETFIKPQFIAAMNEVFALYERGVVIGVHILDSLAPNETGHPYVVINAMYGVGDALLLNTECGNLFRADRADTIPSRIGYVTNLVNSLVAIPAQVADIEGKLAELSAAADEMERRFPKAIEASPQPEPVHHVRGRQKLASEKGEEPT